MLIRPEIVAGYHSLGWEVVVGTANLWIRAAQYDLVHYQWPEEFTGYQQSPSETQIATVENCVAWWSQRARSVITVHNIYPHSKPNDPAFHKLYSVFYRHCDVISHFSEVSRNLVTREFPAAREAHHVVHSPAGCQTLVATQRTRGSRRHELGLSSHAFVLLVLGQLRSRQEIQLIQRAYRLSTIPQKQILMVGRLHFADESWRSRIVARRWERWLRREGAIIKSEWVPDEDLAQIVDSADVVIVPRTGGLNSAIIFLAMAFGRFIIAPDCGAYREHLAGTRNLLYRAGDAHSLANRLDEAATLDLQAIGRENADISLHWSWTDICRACVTLASNPTPGAS